MDWDEPKSGKPGGRQSEIVIGEDLSALSVEELRQRIDRLREEISRIEEDIASKQNVRLRADDVFKKP